MGLFISCLNVVIGEVLVDTSLQHRLVVGDSASGLADQGGGPPIQKGGPEGVFQLLGDHTPQLLESLFQGTGEENSADSQTRIQEEQCGFCPGRGTLDQLCTLCRVLEGSWEFAPTSPHVLCGLGEGIRPCPMWHSVGGALGVQVGGPLLRAVQSMYERSRSLVRIAGSESDLFPVHVGLQQGCPLSLVLFIIFMDIISSVTRLG